MFDSVLDTCVCSVICTVTLCYVKQQTHSGFWHIPYSVFSGICWYIKSYSALLRHIHAYWDIIKVYSDLFRLIQHPVEPLHIDNLVIFCALAYLEPDSYLNLCERLTRHIQNPAKELLFRYIQVYSQPFATLAFAETWHTRNRVSIAIRLISRTLSYLKPDTTAQKMKFCIKNLVTFTEEALNGKLYFLCSAHI